jgi:hypothetical protein
MATTSPDGLYSPDADTPVDFVADWAASMSSVQTALTNRGVKTGTTAQRTAATGVREGTLWYDTSTQSLWAYLSGTWVAAGPSYTGTRTADGIISSVSGVTFSEVRALRLGNLVTIQGTATGTFNTSGASVQIGTLAQNWRPAVRAVGSAFFASSGFQWGAVTFEPTGYVGVWKSDSGNRGSVNFTGTFITP